MENFITSPNIGSIVTYMDGEKQYDVYIIDGQYNGSNGLSNFWYWRPILDDGTLGEIQHGYGFFKESNTKYNIEIKCNKL